MALSRWRLSWRIRLASATRIGAIRDGACEWPDRPLRMIVPLPAGSAVDMVGRLIAHKLSERLGQPVVVENRAGASGDIGADAVAKAPPDGYTLGMATSTTHVTAPMFNAKLPYDPVKDFAPVALVGILPYVLVVQSQAAGQDGRRADRARQGEAADAELLLGRQGEPGASGDRTVRRAWPASSSTTSPTGPRPRRSSTWSRAASTCSSASSAPCSRSIREGKLRALAVTTAKR